jgi:transcriptional regulator with XRE-family HTH domain
MPKQQAQKEPRPSLPTRVTNGAQVGAAVRALRKEQSLRIDDAASLLGVSVDLLSRLENGQGSVCFDKLLAVLDGLGLTLVLALKQDPFLHDLPRA